MSGNHHRLIRAADLFCGAGGTSSGLSYACNDLGVRLNLTAVNHWPIAIETHAANHPDAAHFCASLDHLRPQDAVSAGRLDLLLASPECTHHSLARGGKPIDDQSRASAWHVVRWAEELRPRTIVIENVPEFASWGPLGRNGRPIQRLKGQLFLSFVHTLRALGYAVEWRILNAADYGAATVRRRLIVQAVRGKIRWAEPTHAQLPSLLGLAPWRTAEAIIDWRIPAPRLTKTLAQKSEARIAAGIERMKGSPFLISYFGSGDNVRDLQQPLPTITTHDRFALVIPEAPRPRFRMLHPRELAAAMGFPQNYRLAGTRTDQVKQVGNAVCVPLAHALCLEALRN